MLLEILWFGIGLALLLWGADVLVRGASGLALRFGVSPFVVGVTLVGFGTSAPELTINLTAVAGGFYDLAVGNVVGSNIANIGMVLGASALIAPLTVRMRLLKVETPMLLLVSALFWLMCMDGGIGRIDAGVLLLGFIGMLMMVARDARLEPDSVLDELEGAAREAAAPRLNSLRVILGLILMVFASRLMVGSAVTLAELMGVSQLVIGLTVVAIGTSLPELATSLVAAYRGEVDIAIGNIIGSCLFNILLIIGVSAAVHPLQVNPDLLWVELPMMLAFAVLLYPMMQADLRIDRREGALLMAAFLAFLAFEVIYASAG
jgi:cation:H+ antiporter